MVRIMIGKEICLLTKAKSRFVKLRVVDIHVYT